MKAFDDFTFMIAHHDPEKVVALERGPMRVYWRVAEHHMQGLLAEKRRQERAAKGRRHGR